MGEPQPNDVDHVDRPTTEYMAHQFGAIAQMMTTGVRTQRYPVLTIRHGGDVLNMADIGESLNTDFEDFVRDSGIIRALGWMALIGESHNDPLQTRDPRVQAMQIINTATTAAGKRLWFDDGP